MKCHRFLLLLLGVVLSIIGRTQEQHLLVLPRLEQLSSQRVLQVIQDSEGFLWYATEGGGICRDDGHQIMSFRSDAEHPDLLCSNDVACLAEAAGHYIIIGTFHGASLLDKHDYSIRRLEDVDDKRVDDIIVGRNGHWWLTSNKKVFEYAADGRLLNIYPGGDKYIFRLHEDDEDHIWAQEWEGGLLRIDSGRLVQVSEEWPDTIDFRRIATDCLGNLLVADGFGKCYALCTTEPKPWFDGQRLTRWTADSILRARKLSARPTATIEDEKGCLWFSTGKDIRRHDSQKGEEVILPDTKDVSGMTISNDGTLWLATIFGTVMAYKDKTLTIDDYASNEYGDAVVALQTDSLGRLIIVCDRYVRLYDPVKKTLRQQNIEDKGVYCIELHETQHGQRWSQPQNEKIVERMPLWTWWTLGVLVIMLMALTTYIWLMHQKRKRFLAAIKEGTPALTEKIVPQREVTPPLEQSVQQQPILANEWLQKAITHVEAHIADDAYSIEQLASDLCMSRMTFYRKIQTITGQKPTEFIRTIRLRHAAELLREGNMTVAEVSYATGFSSASYFSRCFRTMFGVPPTLFGKTITAADLSPNEMPNAD